ncbi:hypothetical protein D3C71_1535790 [compost metagenome]
MSRSPSTFSASASGSGVDNRVTLPEALRGQLPEGCNRPDRFRLRSSRCNDTASIFKPAVVQCAASCKPLSSSLPLNNRLPTLISPSSRANGNFSSGSVIGPLSGSSAPGGNVRLT